MTFAEALREARRDRGLTQGQLAVKAGIRYQSIAHWEMGRLPSSTVPVLKLADVLGIDKYDLLTPLMNDWERKHSNDSSTD